MRWKVGADAAAIVLDRKNVGIEIGDPLTTLDGQIESPDRVGGKWLDLRPEEGGIPLSDVGRGLVDEPFVHARFGKLMKEGIEFSRIEGITELTDEIGRPHQAGLGAGLGVIFIGRNRKAREFDAVRQPFRIDEIMAAEPLPNSDFGTLDMEGGEGGIGCAARKRDSCAFSVADETPLAVT